MNIEQKLYSKDEVRQLISDIVSSLLEVNAANFAKESGVVCRELVHEAQSLSPQVMTLIAQEILQRHVQGVTIVVWAGPPGSGKGTNIDTLAVMGKVYAEVTSQGGANQFPEDVHKRLLDFSVSQSSINTGTKGIFVTPEGEYAEFFEKFQEVVGETVAQGGMVDDDIATLFVLLMLLLRLVDGSHRIQLDIWPRTRKQFDHYRALIVAIKEKGAKINQELVNIKVLPLEKVEILIKDWQKASERSLLFGGMLAQIITGETYKNGVKEAEMYEKTERFEFEKKLLVEFMNELDHANVEEIDSIILSELKEVINRMEFRYFKMLEIGKVPRPDEYPLSAIRRLAIYLNETAVAYLSAVGDQATPVQVVSSYAGPDEVIKEILKVLIFKNCTDRRLDRFADLAGTVAIDLVNKKELVVSDLIERVGGILNTENSSIA